MPALRRHFRLKLTVVSLSMPAAMMLRCGPYCLDLSEPRVMGVLNVTPDSFSDGGRFAALDAAIEQAHRMVQAGAALIDIGGESTRPGADDVSETEELRRVIPVIEALSAQLKVPLSIDTSKPIVMRHAVQAGASLINDVYALRAPHALETAASLPAAVCLMHMQGEPRTMQANPTYQDVVADVRSFLEARLEACQGAGIDADRLLLDPGIGFGKQLQHNLALLANLPALRARGRPLLIGVSRKSMFGTLLGRSVEDRLAGGVAVATAGALAGASIIRTHDVPQTLDAIKVAAALKSNGYRL